MLHNFSQPKMIVKNKKNKKKTQIKVWSVQKEYLSFLFKNKVKLYLVVK